jgi:hypothetical protein
MTPVLRATFRAAVQAFGTAASYGLNALFPSHESTDRYWAEKTQPPPREPEPAAAEQDTSTDLYLELGQAIIDGDIDRAVELVKAIDPEAVKQFADTLADLEMLFGVNLDDLGQAVAGVLSRLGFSGSTSAAETERPAETRTAAPSVAAGPKQPTTPGCSGQPAFTVGELEDAGYAVRRHVERLTTTSEIGTEAWQHLAEKFEAAALSK